MRLEARAAMLATTIRSLTIRTAGVGDQTVRCPFVPKLFTISASRITVGKRSSTRDKFTLVIGVLNVVELAEEGLSITLRAIKGEVPFEINFRAGAVENNAASYFFLFAHSAIRVTDAAVVKCLY